MKWAKLARGTVDAGEGLRVRLARQGDEEFLERMSHQAGVGQSASRISQPRYQAGFRAALEEPHAGFYKAVQEAYNRAGEKDPADGIIDAVAAGTYDLVASVSGKPVGSVHMGPPGAVISALWADETIHIHQLVSLMMSVSKLVGVAVDQKHRGKGYGRALVRFAQRAADRTGSLVMFGECPDSPDAATFYESLGFSVLPAGARLNLWPVAGSHLGDHKQGDPSLGPLVQTEPGYRIFAALAAGRNDSIDALANLNPAVGKLVLA